MSHKVLITGGTGDTGRAAVRECVVRGLTVRAMVHAKDGRSAALKRPDVDVVVGDLHDIDTIRQAMEGGACKAVGFVPGWVDFALTGRG
jgi:NAD(P)H dehydrogenase (quinone)